MTQWASTKGGFSTAGTSGLFFGIVSLTLALLKDGVQVPRGVSGGVPTGPGLGLLLGLLLLELLIHLLLPGLGCQVRVALPCSLGGRVNRRRLGPCLVLFGGDLGLRGGAGLGGRIRDLGWFTRRLLQLYRKDTRRKHHHNRIQDHTYRKNSIYRLSMF